LIFRQILLTSSIRNVWRTVRRIILLHIFILELKVVLTGQICPKRTNFKASYQLCYFFRRIRIWNQKCQFPVRKVWKLTPKNVTQITNYVLFFVYFCLKALFFAISNTYVKRILVWLSHHPGGNPMGKNRRSLNQACDKPQHWSDATRNCS